MPSDANWDWENFHHVSNFTVSSEGVAICPKRKYVSYGYIPVDMILEYTVPYWCSYESFLKVDPHFYIAQDDSSLLP